MTSDPQQLREHQAVWELLPWHHTGVLAPAEAARVAAHLARCPRCREELAATATVARAVRAADPIDALAAASLAAVQARIGAAAATPPRPPRAWLLRGAIAAQSALLAVALGVIAWPASAPEGDYVTLTTAEPARGLPVRAAPGVTEAAFRARLRTLELRIVDGPDAGGTWLLAPLTGAGAFAPELLARVAAAPELRLTPELAR